MLDSTGVAVYPWNHGETLTAAALNAAIAQSTGANVGTAAPLSPSIGTLWYNSATGALTVWDGSVWQPFTAAITVGPTAPTTPNNGALWWDSTGGELYVYFNDGTSSQFVAASNYSNALTAAGGTITGPLNVVATGATTSRSVQDHFAEVFNVKDYGAKMDGVTDDSAAVQACANAAGSNPGAVVYFPPSIYPLMLAAGVTAQANQTWWAYPGSVTIMPTAANAGSVLLVGFADHVRLYGLTIDGGGQDFASANPVTQAYHLNGVTLDHVTFQNTHGIAFNGVGVNDLVVRSCWFTNCGNHWKTTNAWADALQSLCNTNGDGVTWGFRSRIIDCTFSECGGDKINLGAIQDVQVVGNTFVNTSKPWTTVSGSAWFAAVFPLFCTDVVVADNLMIGQTGCAIDAPAVWEAVIANNTIRNSGQAGIGIFDGSGYSSYGAARGSRNITITGNLIENSNQWGSGSFLDGIDIQSPAVGGSNIRITNNIITDTQTTKTQHYAVVYTGPAASGVWVDPSNQMAGNAVGLLSGSVLSGLAATDNGNLSFGVMPTNAANDAAAATEGIAVGGIYRNGSVLMVRVA